MSRIFWIVGINLAVLSSALGADCDLFKMGKDIDYESNRQAAAVAEISRLKGIITAEERRQKDEWEPKAEKSQKLEVLLEHSQAQFAEVQQMMTDVRTVLQSAVVTDASIAEMDRQLRQKWLGTKDPSLAAQAEELIRQQIDVASPTGLAVQQWLSLLKEAEKNSKEWQAEESAIMSELASSDHSVFATSMKGIERLFMSIAENDQDLGHAVGRLKFEQADLSNEIAASNQRIKDYSDRIDRQQEFIKRSRTEVERIHQAAGICIKLDEMRNRRGKQVL